MRKVLLGAILGVAAAFGAFAADVAEIPFMPMSPLVLGRGGSFVADARGYESLFFNPAGFSREGGSFTLASASSWIYARPDALVSLGRDMLLGTSTPSSLLGFMNSQVTSGGLGAGSAAGIGYVGNGLGLGAAVILDSLLSGPTLFGLSGDVTGTIGFIGGLSFPFPLGGLTLHLGGDVRPMIRIHVPVDNASALGLLGAVATGSDPFAALSSQNALYGVGIGLDLGAIAEAGWFTFGLAVRDLAGTQFKYSATSYGTLSSTFASQLRFPDGTPATADTYTIPMDISFGMGIHPDFGNFNGVFDPSASIDIHDLVSLLSGSRSVWTLLHVGAQLRILSLFDLTAGLNQGYLTAGFGLRLLFIDINAAVFTRELGAYVGDKPNAGATIDVSIRW